MASDHPLLTLGIAVVAIAGLVLLITTRVRMHPFLALAVTSILMGLVAGMGPEAVIASFEEGIGGTLGDTGVIIALGIVLGKLLAESGGTEHLAKILLANASFRSIPWRVGLLASVVALPMFYEVALAVLLPILLTLAKRVDDDYLEDGRDAQGRRISPYMYVGVPALAAIGTMHGLVPPHPGPLTAADAVGANVGLTLLFGLPIAIVIIVIVGPMFGAWISRRIFPVPPSSLLEQFSRSSDSKLRPPSTPLLILGVVLPVALMLIRAVVDLTVDSGSTVRHWVDFVGEPVTALLISALVATVNFGIRCGMDTARIRRIVDESISAVAPILLVIGAGGGFGSVMVAAGVGDVISDYMDDLGISVLVAAWAIAAAMRLAVGSATVAIVTAAGIVAPIVANDPSVSPELLVLALGAGSVIFPHVNNGGSWMVKESFGMSLSDMFKSYSTFETFISVLGLGAVLALSIPV